MVNPEVIRKRLRKLDEYLENLHALQRYSQEAFLANPERYGSAERFLHLAIEALIDLGNHLVADENLGEVNAYRDIPAILAEHSYISGEQEQTWTQMIAFRNILVHEYATIDRAIVYEVLQSQLHDINDLRLIFAQFL